jgi:hypothetical protein
MFRYPWQEVVLDAAREFEALDLYPKLEKAEAIVEARMAALCEDCKDPGERHFLVEALDTLHELGRGFHTGLPY